MCRCWLVVGGCLGGKLVGQAQSGLVLPSPGGGCGLRERGPRRDFCFEEIVLEQLTLQPRAAAAPGHWIAEHHMGQLPSTIPSSTNPSTTRGYAAVKSWLSGTIYYYPSTESPVRAPLPEATAAPRSIQAGLGLPNPSPGQPPTTGNRPHIRREQRGSPVQLAQGGCSPKPLVPTQPQDPATRAPVLRRHEALAHTCVRPCACARVDLLGPSTSAAHAPPALCATANLPSRQTTRARNPKWAQSGRPARLRAARHLPPDHPSTPATTSTTQPAHQLTFRHDAPHTPVGTLLNSALAAAHCRRFPRSPTCPRPSNPRGRRRERAWVAATTTAPPARDPPHPRPQTKSRRGKDETGGPPRPPRAPPRVERA